MKMKPEKNTFKEELIHRISLIEAEMHDYANNKPRDEDNLYWYYAQEHSMHTEILKLFNLFEDRIGYEKFVESNYTPIKDCVTKEPLKIGDKVSNNNSLNPICGILSFDDYDNKYCIKLDSGAIKPSSFTKIEEFFEYSIDNSKVECRSNPYKQKW